ncbi:hypothetical protein U9M48_017214 [Paspalum notatum var. saurae]|uniref:Uncharacterized protein n=1 Tax=Paspalum notatum var. saurae TaxID=547442 RepID=A0AAQ3T8X9_PASNO
MQRYPSASAATARTATTTAFVLTAGQLVFGHVIFAAVHWVRSWAILQRTDLQDLVMVASQHLARVATDIFSPAHGWRSSLRIECH